MFTSVKVFPCGKVFTSVTPWLIGKPSVHLCENAEGIFPVSYDTGLIKKETPGFSPGSFIQVS
jgi:hypothetical protein